MSSIDESMPIIHDDEVLSAEDTRQVRQSVKDRKESPRTKNKGSPRKLKKKNKKEDKADKKDKKAKKRAHEEKLSKVDEDLDESTVNF